MTRMERSLAGKKCWWFECKGPAAKTVRVEEGLTIRLCGPCAEALLKHKRPKRYMRLVAPWLFGGKV